MTKEKFAPVIELALEAGKAILDIYEKSEGVVIERKADNSPLTIADRESHRIIAAGLRSLFPDMPLLSEEGKSTPYETRRTWSSYWLVDPLDGTKEFINRNGEFTVNIALIERDQPVAGVVYAPAIDLLYFADGSGGAYKRNGGGGLKEITVDREAASGKVAAQSRSHASPEEEELLKKHGVTDTLQVGSSLKFCMVAEGKAHIYPRFGPMMEWDTGAGHAVVVAAGGSVRTWQGKPVVYNTESLRHNGMIVSATEIP